MNERVLITDAEERSILGASRGLERAGYRVSAVARTRLAAGLWSRCCDERIVLSDPRLDPAGFLAGLEEIVSAGRHAVLVPGAEASLIAISDQRHRFERYVALGLPPKDVVVRNLDKLQMLEAATRAGLTAPTSIVCVDERGALSAARELGYPVVLKPNRSVLEDGGRLRQQGIALAHDTAGIAAVVPHLGPTFIVQRFQTARCLFSFTGVFAGQLLCATASRVWRTWPADAGAHSYSETVRPPLDLVRRIDTFLRAMAWQGIFQVQLLELDDERFSLIDFNPRPYASLGLDVRAGANVSAVWCDWLLDRDPVPATAQPGLRYRWEEGEVRNLLWALRRRRLNHGASILRPRRRVVHAHFELTDPGPLVARMLYVASRRSTRSSAIPALGTAYATF